jgi:PAS domain S-box-containing protein
MLLPMSLDGSPKADQADFPAYEVNSDKADIMGVTCSKRKFRPQLSCATTAYWSNTTDSLQELQELSPTTLCDKTLWSEINTDTMASKIVGRSSIREAIEAIVTNSEFCVTLADPMCRDTSIMAVSEDFEKMTGYSRAEVLGKNCRFLNTGCDMDPMEQMRLRHAVSTGSEFTSVLVNRRKSGELFLNLLDLSGLTMAQDPCTGEELWFLVGIHFDVTDVGGEDMLEEDLAKMHDIASGVRSKLNDELAASLTNFTEEGPHAWRLLPVPMRHCQAKDGISSSTPWKKEGDCQSSGAAALNGLGIGAFLVANSSARVGVWEPFLPPM